MANSEHHRKLERMYSRAPCNVHFQPNLSIEDGTATLAIAIRSDYFHAAGATHGSVYFKAMDDAAFFAVNSQVEEVMVLTVSFTVHLVRPISSGTMTARGRLIHASKRLFVAEALLVDGQERLIATGNGTFMRSEVALTAAIGYE